MNKISSNFYQLKRSPIVLTVFWVVVVLFTAILTPLHIDECYYRLFGQDLAWGYFDHPPAVGLFTRISSFIFPGTLGVRLVSIVAHFLTYFLVFRLIDNKKSQKLKLAYLTFCLLLPLNHLYSFITTPDAPLLLTTAIFFTIYKKIEKESTLFLYLLWGASMSLMLYSKYHGVLVIFFTLLSNPRLLLSFKTYLAGAFGILLLLPHLLWQYNHDFVSFVYHLSERMMMFKYSFPIEYWLNVLIIINPLFIGFFIKILKSLPKKKFSMALYFNLLGFLLFFAYQSFKVHVQPQWLFIIYIPLIVLFFNSFEDVQWKYLKKVFLAVFPILIFMHFFMIYDVLPNDLDIHRQKEYVEMIEKDAGGRKVMYYGSYGRASIHSWYGNQGFVHSHNGPRNRKNQFNIWHRDSIFYDEDIYFVGQYGEGDRYIKYPGNYYGIPRQYRAVDKAVITVLAAEKVSDSLKVEVEIYNPYEWNLNLTDDYAISAYYFKNGKSITARSQFPQVNKSIQSNQVDTLNFSLLVPQIDFDQFGAAISHVKGTYGPVHRRFHVDKIRLE